MTTTDLPSWQFLLATVLVVAAVTFLLRLAPFVALHRVRDWPVLTYLGTTMPLGVMAILAIYAVPAIDLSRAPFGLPELVAVAVTAGLHLWRSNALVSLAGGTATYMVLIALV